MDEYNITKKLPFTIQTGNGPLTLNSERIRKIRARISNWIKNPICKCSPMNNDGDCFKHQILPDIINLINDSERKRKEAEKFLDEIYDDCHLKGDDRCVAGVKSVNILNRNAIKLQKEEVAKWKAMYKTACKLLGKHVGMLPISPDNLSPEKEKELDNMMKKLLEEEKKMKGDKNSGQ